MGNRRLDHLGHYGETTIATLELLSGEQKLFTRLQIKNAMGDRLGTSALTGYMKRKLVRLKRGATKQEDLFEITSGGIKTLKFYHENPQLIRKRNQIATPTLHEKPPVNPRTYEDEASAAELDAFAVGVAWNSELRKFLMDIQNQCEGFLKASAPPAITQSQHDRNAKLLNQIKTVHACLETGP